MLNIAEGVESNARNNPDHPAIVEGDRVITYRQFARDMRGLASRLLGLGLPANAIVGVSLRDTAQYLTILYGLARAGLVVLPIDCRWTPAEKERVARHFGASLVLVEPGDDVLSDDIPTQVVDADWFNAMTAPADAGSFPSEGSTPLLLSLSSGTTGRPKGPMVNHGHFLRRFMTHWIDLGLNSHDRYMSATPLYFGGGRMFCMSMLFCGGTVVMFPPPFNAHALVRAAESTRTTSIFLVPTQIRRLLDLNDVELAPLRVLKTLLVSGAPLSREERVAIRRRICPNFAEYYAATEGGGISLLRPEDQDAHGDSVGRPIFAVEVDIADDDGASLQPREVGLLRYRGPGVADRFYRDEEASQDAFRDGWFYPGDLAERDEQGFIRLRGRRKDMIIRGGINIYPNEVEAALLTHPAVADASVAGLPSVEFGEEVVAFVRTRAETTPEQLAEWCATSLASYKRPKLILNVDDFPRNSFGKVLKKDLIETYAAKLNAMLSALR
jgi:acyl-CoA synthetase (AMP-forming)/AMP-acid ligase II